MQNVRPEIGYCKKPITLKQAVNMAMEMHALESGYQKMPKSGELLTSCARHRNDHLQSMEDSQFAENFNSTNSQRNMKLAMHWLPATGEDHPQRGFKLSEIDKFLDCDKPPAIEYLVVETIVTKNPLNVSQLGRWAHSAIRYTLPTGEQKLVNICRPGEGNELIEFYDDPKDYILGIQGKGGVFSRDIASIRIEKVNDSSMWALHHTFVSTSFRFKADGKGAQFQLTGGFWHNLVRYLFRLRHRPSGNCARWISKGLVYANVLKRASMFPKSILREVLEDQVALNADNVHVVYYNRIKAKAKAKGFLKTGYSFISTAAFYIPSGFVQNWIYWDLRKFADVIVDNDESLSVDEQISELKCTLKPGTGFRVYPWAIFLLRLANVFTVLFAVGFYIVYCPHEYNPKESFGTCSSSWPDAMGFRALLAVIFISITQFWLN